MKALKPTVHREYMLIYVKDIKDESSVHSLYSFAAAFFSAQRVNKYWQLLSGNAALLFLYNWTAVNGTRLFLFVSNSVHNQIKGWAGLMCRTWQLVEIWFLWNMWFLSGQDYMRIFADVDFYWGYFTVSPLWRSKQWYKLIDQILYS